MEDTECRQEAEAYYVDMHTRLASVAAAAWARSSVPLQTNLPIIFDKTVNFYSTLTPFALRQRRLPRSTAIHHYQHHHQQRRRLKMAAEPDYTPRATETVYHIAREVVQLLNESSETLGVAESLTGGGIMSTMTSIEGCSSVFRGGVVSYATPLKQHLLQVDGDLISEHGVIHPGVAAQMATGARTVTTQEGLTPTSWGIGTTGVAGPDPQDDKPVGMVYIGVSSASGSKGFGPFHFPGAREQVRQATILEALFLLRQELLKAKQGN